jgi:hypothetical protein
LGEPKVGGGRVRGGRLDGELDVGILVFRILRGGGRRILHESSGRWRGYGEAARFGDRGDVDVQPLAWEVAEGRLLSMKVLERFLVSFKGCRL